MIDILQSEITLLLLTIGAYMLGLYLQKISNSVLLNPILVCIIVCVTYLKVFNIEYSRYLEANKIIDFMLGLSVVSLGYLLHNRMEVIKANLLPIITSVTAGAVVGIVSVIVVATLFDSPQHIIASLQPKSVTTPIAIIISQNSGGIASLTAVAVIVTGILGNIFGKYILRLFGIKSPLAIGLSLGSAAHGVGTAKAIEMGAVEGATGGLAIGIMGAITAILVPIIEKIIEML